MSTDRTFAATPRKRKAARREGRVARSSELVAAGSSILALVVLYYFGSQVVIALANQLKGSLTNVSTSSLAASEAPTRIGHVCLLMAGSVIPVLVLIATVPILMHWLQFGFLFSPGLIRPRLSRILPRSRPGGPFTVQNGLRASLNLIKLAGVSILVGFYLYDELPELMQLMTLPTASVAISVGRTIVRFGFLLGGVLLVPAVLDYFVARWQFTSDLRMTREEIREEQRTSIRRKH